ncbi:MAG: hypothetical protein V8S77_03465 [Oscillospiraceae bacterium]
MQTNNKMAVAPVGKLIWQMSIPPLISMFLQYSYNLIDSAFIARLSENALNGCFSVIPDYNIDECSVYLDRRRRECADSRVSWTEKAG